MSDFRDYFILVHANAAGIATGVYTFTHADIATFATWCALLTTLIGAYHWFVLKDSKTPDA